MFEVVGLSMSGPKKWMTSIPESRIGVYVVAIISDASGNCHVDAEYLPARERMFWSPEEPIVYIGCTRCRGGISRRLSQFYRHKYGDSAPHSGGEAVKLLRCGLWVYWASAEDPLAIEDAMLSAFFEKVGTWPFANRNKAGRTRRQINSRGDFA